MGYSIVDCDGWMTPAGCVLEQVQQAVCDALANCEDDAVMVARVTSSGLRYAAFSTRGRITGWLRSDMDARIAGGII